MLTYTFNEKETLTNQLYQSIKEDIINRNLKPHEKLPSKKRLASHLHLSVITIENAYSLLVSEGYLYTKNRVGFFVSDLAFPDKQTKPKSHLSIKKEEYYLDFSSSLTDPNLFPYTSWNKVNRKVLNDYQEDLLKPSLASGTLFLRKAIQKHLLEFRGIYAPLESIIIGAGSEYLYHLLFNLIDNKYIFGIETPGYPLIENLLQLEKINYKKILVESKGINIDKIQNIDILHVTPSHHFPTGIITPIDKRLMLINWLKDHAYLIEDDFDSELRSNGKPLPSLYALDDQDKVIYMNTFSKTLASNIRISYMILPETLTKRFYQKLSFYSCPVSTFEQYHLGLFINEGYFEKHLNRIQLLYKKKRDYLFECLKQSPLSYTIYEENAGLHFLIYIDMDISDELFLDNCKKYHLSIKPLSYFGLNRTHTFLMNYSYLDENKIKKGLELLYQCTKANSI